VAKRRFRTVEAPPEEVLTPEQRRTRRRRDRELRRKGKRPPTGRTSRSRRVLLLSVPVVVIVAVVLLLVFTNFFQTPCLKLQPIPSSSGLPAFPLHNTTDFTGTWCPPGASPVQVVFPYLRINIEGQSVGIPPTQSATSTTPDFPSIGRNASYPGNYACDLPLYTRPPLPAQGFPNGVIYLVSPWPYVYNLSAFFYVWQQSFSGVYVNTSYSNQPIVYQTNELLGFTADATHRVELFVDGAPSSAGPSLELNTLDYATGPQPQCLSELYGTGHTILLEYVSTSSTAVALQPPPAGLVTAGPNPMGYLVSLGGPLQKVGNAPASATDRAHAAFAGLAWLALKGAP
jgi:hypothetical protein